MCAHDSDPKNNDKERINAASSGRNFTGQWPKTPARLIGIGLIRAYQLTLSSIIGSGCRHQPTCSEFGYEAIARHGLLPGVWLTLFRVAKCNPFGTSGYDPVPKKMIWSIGNRKKTDES